MKGKFTLLLALMMMCSMFAAPVQAQSALQDGIEVTLTTDKESYDALETIYAELTVKNTNSFDVSNITAQITVPAGYELDGDEEAKIGTLLADEAYQHRVAIRETAAPAPVLPQTGDASHSALWSALLVVSVAVLCALVIRNPQAKRVISLFLCVAIVGPYVMQAVPVQAQTQTAEIVVRETVTMDGEAVMLTAKAAYEPVVQVFTLRAPITIITQPESQTVSAGQKASFTVEAEGDGLTYQWYYRKSGASSWTKASGKTETYSFTMKESYANREIRCKITDAIGNVEYTDIVTLKLPVAKITTQPKSQTVSVGKTAKFTIAATGDGLKYQWYYKKSGASSWTKASSTKATYSFTMKESYANRQIRCKVTDQYGNTVTSKTVKLTLPAVKITTQPTSQRVAVGKTAKFTVKATGDGLKYQWYYRKIGASSWKKASSTKATYSFTMKESYANRQIRCKVTDRYGNTVTSSTVTLKPPVVKITTQPESKTVAVGGTAKFTIAATGDGLKYQWYYRKSGASSWTKASSTKATYSFTMKESYANREIRCKVTDRYGTTVTSSTVTLKQAVKITTQPTDAWAYEGETAKPTVKAIGDGLTYQWYYKDAGQTEYSKSSNTGASCPTTMTAARDGRTVYCVVTDAYGNSVKSNEVTLDTRFKATITEQPKNVSVINGGTATAAVTATGDGLTYQWYYKNPGSTSFSKGGTDPTTSITMTEAHDGRQMYCVVTDAYGNTAQSDTITMIAVNFTYTAENGEATITKYLGAASSVTVPQTMDGYPVTAIGDDAFAGNTTLTHVTLPNGVETIGQRAFKGCTGLTGMDTY